MPELEFYREGHLGGAVKGGDPATYYPSMWEFFIKYLNIHSVFDLGCGEGQSLHFFKQRCPGSVGVDGCQIAIDAGPVSQYIECHDFTKSIYYPSKTYDMVWSCEFVEHVEEKYKHHFLDTIRLTGAEYVFMTFAVPGQGGHHHVNCQQSSYWVEELDKYDYCLDAQLTRMARTIAGMEQISGLNHFASHGLIFRKQKPVENKKDAVISWASGSEFCKKRSFKVFVNSLNSCGFEGDKIIFTENMDIEDREYLDLQGFRIIDVNPNKVRMIIRDRFLAWANYLQNHVYRYVLLLDSKDVVFQKNPIEHLASRNHTLYFVNEGKKHQECDWNTADQKAFQSDLKLKGFSFDFSELDVICGGTIMGCGHAIKNLIMNIWSTSLMSNGCSDQAALNFLYHTMYKNDKGSCLVNPKLNSLVATADLPYNRPPVLENDTLKNYDTNEVYYLWHQWDRTCYKDIILEKYS